MSFLYSNMIDSHTHIQLASYQDLENMAMAGIDRIVTCTVGSGASSYQTYKDEISNLFNVYRKNAKENGIDLYIAVGIHPANIPQDWKNGLSLIEEYLSDKSVVALGEVGINSDRQVEEDVFIEIIKIAKKHDKPIIVHTPFKNRLEIVKKESNAIESIGLNPELVVIDHANMDVISFIREKNYYPGLTVKEGRLTPMDVLNNINEFENGMLNSDVANLSPSDALSVPKTVKLLKAKNIDKKIIENISEKNALRFLGKI